MKNDITDFKKYLLDEEKQLLRQPNIDQHFESNDICEVEDPLLEDYKHALSHAILNWKFHMIHLVLEHLFEKHEIKMESPEIDWENKETWALDTVIEEKDGKRIGFYKERISKSRAAIDADTYQLNESYVIRWVKELSQKDKEFNELVATGQTADELASIKALSAKELFERFFSLNEYYVYLEAAKRSSINMREQIGYRITRNIKTSYLSNFKSSIRRYLNETHYESLRFEPIDDYQEDGYALTAECSEHDLKTMKEQFIGKKSGYMLIDDFEFGKSFVTSEYLFKTISEGENFDFTSVISGYIKTIEQLLYFIFQRILKNPNYIDLFIKKVGGHRTRHIVGEFTDSKTGITYVPLREENERFFDLSLGSLIRFLLENSHFWNVDDRVLDALYDYLEIFRRDCRNDHFHKDNLYKWEDVITIRNNTLVLCFLIIGGIKRELLNDVGYYENVYKRERFDELARKIRENQMLSFFSVQLLVESNQKIMIWTFDPEDEFDALGFMKPAWTFKKVDDFFEGDMYADDETEKRWHKYYDDNRNKDDVLIDPDHLPVKMWVKPLQSQEMELIFSLE